MFQNIRSIRNLSPADDTVAVDDVELSSVVCITVSCIVTTDNEVPTSDVVVVELCEGPLNNDEVFSTWLEDPVRLDCLGSDQLSS